MDEYNQETQKLLLQFMISNAELFQRSNAIIKPEYFHTSLRKIIRHIQSHSDEFHTLPTPAQIKAKTGVSLKLIDKMTDGDCEWYLRSIERFCKERAIEEWLIKGTDLIKDGQHDRIEKGLKEALTISLFSNIGTFYFEDPKTRLLSLKDSNGQQKTGFRDLDELLYGGFNRGEINIFAGGTGAGKSLFLQNIALNWALDGLMCVYLTLELSEEYVAMRLDSMVTGFGTKKIYSKIDEVDHLVRLKARGTKGELIIKYISSGATTNQIRALLTEIAIQTGKYPDALFVDYLDLVYPNDKRINPSDLFIKDKFVSEELRAFANDGLSADHKLFLVTASQLNRSAVDEIDYNHANIAGGISKIMTCDNLFAIYTSKLMKDRGRYQLQLLKTRNSAGTGEKVNLFYDNNSMRITDLDEEEENTFERNIFEELKEKNVITRNQPEESTQKSTVTPTKSTTDILSIINDLDKR